MIPPRPRLETLLPAPSGARPRRPFHRVAPIPDAARAFASALALTLLLVLLPTRGRAAEITLDFTGLPPGPAPAQYRPALTGAGPAPDWRVVLVDAPSALPALPGQEPPTTRETVLAQLSQDPTDERFPLLIYQPETFADFTATLKFRTSSGKVEQMAGLAFRLVDERNYYVVRVSSLGNNVRFYKFVDGVRSDPIGPAIKVPAGTWHTLQVICKGNSIRCLLDDREVIPPLTDLSFARGRFALWTKSDAVSHFARLHVDYDLVKTLPQRLVDQAREKFPRLLGVSVFAREPDGIRSVAASDASLVGKPATEAEELALNEGKVSAGTAKDHAIAVLPLRDRNGDLLFAVRFKMRTFGGQTDNNAAARGRQMLEELEALVRAAEAGGTTTR